MKKKMILGLLVLTMVMLPLLVACAEPAAEPAPAPATPQPAPAEVTPAPSSSAEVEITAKPETAPEVEVRELRLSTHLPPMNGRVFLYQEWGEKIAEASNGAITVTVFPAGTLLGQDDLITGVRTGIADMGELTIGGDIDLFPTNNILGLPFLGLGDTIKSHEIWMTLMEQYPVMQEEFAEYKIPFSSGSGADAFAIHTTNREVRVPEDVKGLKIQSEGGLVTVLDNLGAAPMICGAQDWYMNLQTGVLEAMVMNWMACYEMGLFEFLKYHTIFPGGTNFGQMMMLMNMNTWNSLPPDIQELIDDLRPWMEEGMFASDYELNSTGLADAEAQGHTIITLTEEEEALWYQAALSVHEEYLATYDAQGLPATEIYEEALRLAGED